MIYIIKCAYCGKTYILDTDENVKSFVCESCSGANGLENVQEKFLNKEEFEAARKRRLDEIWEDEGSLDAIKSFQISWYPAAGSSGTYDGFGTESNYFSAEETAAHDVSSSRRTFVWVSLVVVAVLLIAWKAYTAYVDYSYEQKIEQEVQRRMEEDDNLNFLPVEWQIEHFRKQVEEEYNAD